MELYYIISGVLIAFASLLTRWVSLKQSKVDFSQKLLESQNEFIKEVRNDYNTKVKELLEAVNAFEKDRKESQFKINKLTTEVENYKNHTKKLEVENAAQKKRIEGLELKVKELQSERINLLKQINLNHGGAKRRK